MVKQWLGYKLSMYGTSLQGRMFQRRYIVEASWAGKVVVWTAMKGNRNNQNTFSLKFKNNRFALKKVMSDSAPERGTFSICGE